jgi:hypothetical protein
MGYEYKIFTEISDTHKRNIEQILKHNILFAGILKYGEIITLEFRKSENKKGMPTFLIEFENDGIYICKNDFAEPWKDIGELKEYLELNDINFSVLDYSD